MPDKLDPESEASLLSKVTKAAHLYGWATYHTRRSDRSEKGWPDLVLCRPPRILFVELKTNLSQVSPDQLFWLHALQDCNLVTRVWRPQDWDMIVQVLETGKAG